jgi:insecticidal toxin complex protein TccC
MKTTRASGSLLQDLTYEHDPVGNILSISDAAQPASFFKNQHVEAANAYTYDSFYQLVTASGRESNQAVQQGPSLPVMITDPNNVVNYTRQYAYDTAGNLLSIQHHGASSYRNDIVVAAASNHSVAQNSSLSLTPADIDKGIYFDECGNSLQLQTGQPMTWNTDNQLKTVILIDRDTTEASDREVYLYDSAGGRICKQTLTQTSGTWQTQQVIYLPGLELRSTQANNGTTVNTLEMLDLIATSPAGRAGVRILHWESGQPDGIPNDQQRYSLGNQIGSVNMELDIGANILTVEEYYPFGGTAVLGAKSDSEVKYKFVRYSGKERDGTGLYYYGHRYYMPWLARWLNPDPLGTSDGLNLYQMVKNNPIGLLDPNGGKSTTYEHVRVLATNLFMRKGEGGATATFRGLRIARTIFGGLLVAGIAVGIAAAASTGVIVVAALIGGGIGALAAYHAPTIAKAFAHGVSKLAFGIFGKHTTMAAAATGGLTGAAMATATGGGAQAIATGATAGAAVAAGAAFFGGDQVTAEAAGIGAGVGAGLGWALSHRPAETRAAAFEGSAVAAAYEAWSGNTGESYHIGESAALGAYYGGGFGRRIDLRIGSMYASIAGFFTQTIASSVFGGHRKVVSVAKLAGKLGALGARHYAKAATGRFERGFSWLGGGFGALSAAGGAALTAATFAASAAAFISGGWIPALAVGGTVAALGYASGVNEVINPVIDQEWGIHMEASRGHNIRNAMLGLGANAARRELNNVVHHIEGRIPGFSRA